MSPTTSRDLGPFADTVMLSKKMWNLPYDKYPWREKKKSLRFLDGLSLPNFKEVFNKSLLSLRKAFRS